MIKGTLALLAAFVIAAVVAFSTTAYAITLAEFEGESMSASSSVVAVASDANASGGKAMRYTGKENAQKAVNLSNTATTLTVRARGVSDGEWPELEIYEDVQNLEHKIAKKVIDTPSYQDHTFTVDVSKGTHTIIVRADDNMTVGQELWVDRVTLADDGAPPPEPPRAEEDTDCDGIADASDPVDNRFGVLSTKSAFENRAAFVSAINADKDLHVCGGDTAASDDFDLDNSIAIDTIGASGSVHMERGAYFDLTSSGMGFRFIVPANFELYGWRVLGINDGSSSAFKNNTIFRGGSSVLVNGSAAEATSMDGIFSPAGYGEINTTSGAGLIFYGTSRPTVKNMRIINTGRDGIHFNTNLDAVAHNIYTYRTGDDALAFLNYESYANNYSGFSATDVTVIESYKARGIAVVGQRDGTIDGFRIEGTHASGVYVVEEDGAYQTREPSNVTVKNGCINNAGQIPKNGTYAGHRNAVSYGSVGSGVRFENISAYNYGSSLARMLNASPEGLNQPVELVSVYSRSTAC